MRISVQQSKGGVGKSTLCKILASALAAHERPVVLYDTDPQGSLVKWQSNAAAAGQASALIEVVAHLEFDALLRDIEDRRARRPDQTMLIDTAGLAQEFPFLVAQISELVIVPTRLNADDATEAIEVFRALDELQDKLGSGGTVAPSVLAFTLTETRSRWTREAKLYHQHLSEMPHLPTCVRRLSAFEKMQARGPLPALIERLADSDDARVRIQASEYRAALDNAAAVLADVEATLAELRHA